jgi:DNA primase small subunit
MAGLITPKTYYRDHFPWDHLVAFLTRHGDELCKREFAIEGDYYKRYVVAKDATELKRLVSEFSGVTSFHVGPVYSDRVVRNSEKQQSRPVRRELVFDIDLTDYDFLDLNTAEGDIDMEACDAAWPVCATAVFVLQWLLKDAFGFKEFMVVYSGRRGVHVYVCDDKAMNLTNEERSAIVDFLKFDESGDKLRASAQLAGMMKTQGLNEAVHFAFEEFFVKGLKLFDDPGARVAFIERLGLSEEHLPVVSNLAEAVLDLPNGEAMWVFVNAKVASLSQQWMRDRLDAMVLAYVWPRIDANVSRQLNHLLKAPFVAHPKCKRVAVAVDAVDYFRFDPATAPRLAEFRNPTTFFQMRDAMKWLRPCDVAVEAPAKKKGAKTRTKTTKPKAARKKAASSTATQDVSMADVEDLAGPARSSAARKPNTPFVRKRSPLSQAFTDTAGSAF